MGSLVFVLTELRPDVEGEAGPAIVDMLRAMSAEDRERTTLCLVDCLADTAPLAATFPDVHLFPVDTRVDQGRLSNGRQHPPARAYPTTPSQWRSAVVFRALATLAERGAIDYLEFPDRGALAFCTLQERNLRGFLGDATIAVRIGTSQTQLMRVEAQALEIEHLHLSDLERKCLRDCDRIVAPLLPVAEATRQSFGFSVEEWSPRIVEHAPPVLPEPGAAALETVDASLGQTLVFPSTLRRVNRPDLFARAVGGFLRTTPDYTGAIVFGAPGVDPEYQSDIERLVPADCADRVGRMPATRDPQRKALLRGATVVIAASWDSFCPVAYEASLLGARLILNETNPAFGAGTPWEDGINCLKFDGSMSGLVDALKRNVERNERLRPVALPMGPWPWLPARRERGAWRRLDERPLVSVVIAHHNLGAYLPETLASVRAQNYGSVEIVLVDDASTDPQSVLGIEALALGADPALKVVRLPGNVGLAAARNVGVRHAAGQYVLTLDADDLIHPDFIAVGVESLENRPEFDLVVTPAGYFLDGQALPTPGKSVEFAGYAVFCGEAVVGGLIENRFSTATALFRKSAMVRFPYEESLSCFEDWSLYLRMCEAGVRFVVTNDVFFYYRRRINSMVHTPRDPMRKRIEYGDLMRTSAPESLKRRSRQLVIGIASPVAIVPKSPFAEGLFGAQGQYDEQVAFASLKLSRWLERRLPWLIDGGVWISSRAWRAYRALRG
ncbi:glycosyltransferase [Variovorax sp. M-6]|uniref:glycosyltransferase n=1 Tax=Variovorax sp. M-6 TaxID=3233041 RepID=UPI003F9E5289